MIQSDSARAQGALLFLATAPALVLLLLILKYGVDLIDWDQWAIAALFAKAAHGSLSFSDLFAQQAEYRSFFPNLIFLGLGWLTHWNTRYEMLVSFSLACLTAFNIYRLGKLTLGGSRRQLLILTLIANLLIFSPAQFENWLLGEQIIYFMPIACLTTGLLAAYSKFHLNAKLLICIALSTVSTFSSANGILCWITLFPVLLFSFSAERRRLRHIDVSIWSIGFALNLLLYLLHYRKPPYVPSLSVSLYHPLRASLFFLALLGAPLSTTYRFIFIAVSIGAMLTAIFAASWLYLARLIREREMAYRLIGWLMLGAYSFLTAIIITVARTGFGLAQSVISRYTTFSLYLLVSLLYLIPIILDDLNCKADLAKFHRALKCAATALLVAMITLDLLNAAVAVRRMSLMRMRRLQAKACLLFVNAVPDECLKAGFPGLDILTDRANAMNGLFFLRPRLINSKRVEDVEDKARVSADSYGTFENLVNDGSDFYTASGWASLPYRGEPADAVLLAYQTADQDGIIFAIADVKLNNSLLGDGLASDSPSGWRWQKSFLSNRIPGLPASLSAWAFDANTGKAYRLSATHTIER